MKMYNLTLSMIVKNEAPNIERCLASVAPFINYYVICDTGSTDNTKEIIKKFFDEKGIPGEILDQSVKAPTCFGELYAVRLLRPKFPKDPGPQENKP